MIELTEKQKRFIERTRAKIAKASVVDTKASAHWEKKTEVPIGMGKDGKIIVVSDKQ
jgi:hypothetical protein